MNDQIIQFFCGILMLFGAGLVGYFASRKYLPIVQHKISNWLSHDRHIIRDKVSKWLLENNLNKTALTKVVSTCDSIAGFSNKLICKVYVETEKTGKVKVHEEIISIDELEKLDTDVAKKVIENISNKETNIMSQIM